MRRHHACFAALLLFIMTTAPVRAQRPHDAEIMRLRTRLDSLKPRLQEINAGDSAQRREALDRENERENVSIDTAAVGPFLIVGASHAVRGTRKYLERAWMSFEPQFRGATDSLAGRVLLVSQGTRVPPNVESMAGRPRHAVVIFPRGIDQLRSEVTASSTIGRYLMPGLPPSVRQWLGGDVLGMRNDAAFLHRHLVLPRGKGSSAAGYRCAEGDIAACSQVLGLREVAAGRTDPLRTSFLMYVLELAPAGSVAALRMDTAPAGTVLEKLGGAPLDTLIRGWMDAMKTARAAEAGTSGRRVLSTLAWIAVLGALATRSTRWRLG